MYRMLGRFEWGLAAIGGGLCLLAILLLTVVTVFGRYVLAEDLIPGGYNMIEAVLFPLLVFWGLPLAHREGAFPRLEMLDTALPGPVAKLVSVFVLAVEALIYSIVAWYCAHHAWSSWEADRALQIGIDTWPAWPVVVMAPIAFALMLAEALRLLLRDARTVFGR